MQDSSSTLQQEISMSLSYFNGLKAKVILLGREKSEGIWSSVQQFAYAAVMIISQPCLRVRQLLKEWEQKCGSVTVPCSSQRRDSRACFHQWNQAGWPVSFPLHYPVCINKISCLIHSVCGYSSNSETDGQGKQTAPSGFPPGASHLLCSGKCEQLSTTEKTELWANACFPTWVPAQTPKLITKALIYIDLTLARSILTPPGTDKTMSARVLGCFSSRHWFRQCYPESLSDSADSGQKKSRVSCCYQQVQCSQTAASQTGPLPHSGSQTKDNIQNCWGSARLWNW